MKDIILKRRKELGLTQQQLAEKLYISDKVISKWETGKSIPDTAILVDLAKALDITVNDLLSVDNVNTVDIAESIKIMLKSKYNNLTIIFLNIEIIAALIIVFGRLGIEDYEDELWPYILIICGFLIELFNISYLLITRNNLSSKYTKIIQIEKKCINYLILASFPIIIFVTIIFVLWGNPGASLPEKLMLISSFTLAFVILSLIFLWFNNKRK